MNHVLAIAALAALAVVFGLLYRHRSCGGCGTAEEGCGGCPRRVADPSLPATPREAEDV